MLILNLRFRSGVDLLLFECAPSPPLNIPAVCLACWNSRWRWLELSEERRAREWEKRRSNRLEGDWEEEVKIILQSLGLLDKGAGVRHRGRGPQTASARLPLGSTGADSRLPKGSQKAPEQPAYVTVPSL